jgi:hypothetical protein
VPNLKLIKPAEPSPVEKVRQRVKAAPKPGAVLQCRCGSREMIETKTGVLLIGGKPTGGTKQYICAACLMNGERVVVA